MFQKPPTFPGWQSTYKRLMRSLFGQANAAAGDERVMENAGLLLEALRGKPAGKQVAEQLSRVGSRGMKFLGGGLERVVFDIGDDKVMKLGFHHDPDLPRVPELVPTLQKSRFGDVTMEIAPKVQTEGVTQEMTVALRKKLAARGYHWNDRAERNVGFYRGKPTILDPGFIKKSRIRRTYREKAMKAGLDPDVISRRLDMLVREHKVRHVAQLPPGVFDTLREQINMNALRNKEAMLARAKAVAKMALENGGGKAAAGKVLGAAARVMKGLI